MFSDRDWSTMLLLLLLLLPPPPPPPRPPPVDTCSSPVSFISLPRSWIIGFFRVATANCKVSRGRNVQKRGSNAAHVRIRTRWKIFSIILLLLLLPVSDANAKPLRSFFPPLLLPSVSLHKLRFLAFDEFESRRILSSIEFNLIILNLFILRNFHAWLEFLFTVKLFDSRIIEDYCETQIWNK